MRDEKTRADRPPRPKPITGGEFRRLQEQLGMSNKDLHYELGVNHDSVSGYRNDRVRIPNPVAAFMRLRVKVHEHNQGCVEACNEQDKQLSCAPYRDRGRRCPDCPMDWMIEL